MQARTSWQIQKAVFFALFRRELQTRFGGYRLGYFWALIEPLSHIIMLSALFSLIRSDNEIYRAPFPVFFALGILSFFIFQKIAVNGQNSIRVNLGLFCYRQVKPFDSIVVRAFIDFCVYLLAILFLALLGGWFFEYQVMPVDPLKSLLVLMLLFTLGLGVSFFTAVIAVLYEEWSQFIGIALRPMYFISGIFFPLAALPERLHVYLLWNPILHGVEALRGAWIVGYPAEKVSILYLAAWSLIILFLGMSYYRSNRVNVLMS